MEQNQAPQVIEGANITPPDPNQKPDIQLFSAGQTIVLLSQLLGASLRRLAAVEGREPDTYAVITPEEIQALDNLELQHGDTPQGIAIRVAAKGAPQPSIN